MNKFVFAGLGVVAAIVGGALWLNRGSHVVLEGSVLKVRLQPVEAASTIAVLDFRFSNPANYPFVVRRVEVFADDAAGKEIAGDVISDTDIRRVFDYYKASLGEKFNDSLVMKDRVAARQSMDRMIAASFPLSEDALAKRKRFRIRVEDVDGPVSEIIEDKK